MSQENVAHEGVSLGNGSPGNGLPREGAQHVVVGLGNPGERYAATRHNLGAWVVGELARRRGVTLALGPCSCLAARTPELDLAFPQTYMNRSGHAVRCLVERYRYAPEHILIVYDEVALPLGTLRLRPQGSPGGHRGMESIIEGLGTTAIPRLRVGIAPAQLPGGDLADFVLAPFTPEELATAAEQVGRASDACEAWLRRGIAAAMNEWNG